MKTPERIVGKWSDTTSITEIVKVFQLAITSTFAKHPPRMVLVKRSSPFKPQLYTINECELGFCSENATSLELGRNLCASDRNELDMCRFDGANNSLLQSLNGQEPVDRRHLEEDLLQEIVSHLLTNKQLNEGCRLGSSELVQLRKLFQGSCGKCAFLDTQLEVKVLESEMRDLKVEGMELESSRNLVDCGFHRGNVNHTLETERIPNCVKNTEAKTSTTLTDLTLRIGDVTEPEKEKSDNAVVMCNGKRRTSCDVEVSKSDVKKRRGDVHLFTNFNLPETGVTT